MKIETLKYILELMEDDVAAMENAVALMDRGDRNFEDMLARLCDARRHLRDFKDQEW